MEMRCKVATFVFPGCVSTGSGKGREWESPTCKRNLIRWRPTGMGVSRNNIGWRMVEVGGSDKRIVTEYFNKEGFDRWRRIYSEDGEINNVQKDIREGHAETVQKILKWIDDDGDCKGQRFCDAGCGVGSLTLPLVKRGAIVAASDISRAMVVEARERVEKELGDEMVKNVNFAICDLENLGGRYDTVCCIDVMIHYPKEKVAEMIQHLGSLATERMILTFAPWTFWLGALKKVGDFFPGPSKATRAYLHKEEYIRSALEASGWKVRRSDLTAKKFYFSKLLEAVKDISPGPAKA